MPVRCGAVVAAVAVVLVCVGCVPQAPGPLPQATPSFSCTPVAGGTPYPCYENQYQETAAQNKLYEQAEAVYRRYNAENVRILKDGGVSEATTVLLATTTNGYLEEAMAEYRNVKEVNGGLLNGDLSVAWIRRFPDSVRAGSLATLEVCKDISDATFRGAGGKRYRIGEDNVERVYFVDVDGQLKISSAQYKRVKSC